MTRLAESQLADLLKANPDISVAETIVRKRPAIPAAFEADTLCARFEALWAALGGPALEKEYRFDAHRKWRFDFCEPITKFALELNGGVWSGGRHVRGGGYLRDREKVNAAQLQGWKVIELGTGQVTAEQLQPVIDGINNCLKQAQK